MKALTKKSESSAMTFTNIEEMASVTWGVANAFNHVRADLSSGISGLLDAIEEAAEGSRLDAIRSLIMSEKRFDVLDPKIGLRIQKVVAMIKAL